MSDDFDFESALNNSKDGTIPRFYNKPVKNEFRSQQEGRPVFEDKEYVEIIVPGNRGTVVDERVKDHHRERWPTQYAAFKARQEAVIEGTPIEEWAAVTRSMAEELKYNNVRTVEALATISDANLNKVMPMGGHQLRAKAQAWLKQAADSAPASAMIAENAELKAEVVRLKEQVREIAAEAQKKKRETVDVGA